MWFTPDVDPVEVAVADAVLELEADLAQEVGQLQAVLVLVHVGLGAVLPRGVPVLAPRVALHVDFPPLGVLPVQHCQKRESNILSCDGFTGGHPDGKTWL